MAPNTQKPKVFFKFNYLGWKRKPIAECVVDVL